ncbi:MAG: histidine phosphatase family protein [Candidatus Magnetominusculus sp. LBB02]|nr:histidine phosphatase family protein [Candidatus Magnetominusculus sp. LBB02]
MDNKLKIWLVRHGESEVNRFDKSRFYGTNPWSELTTKGRCQSIALGEKLKGEVFDLWLCSPAVRAQQTCRYFHEGMYGSCEVPWVRYELDQQLLEQSQGDAEGHLKSEYEYCVVTDSGSKMALTSSGVELSWRQARPYKKDTSKPASGAESQDDVFERAKDCILRNIRRLPEGKQNTQMIAFTHETVIKCLCRGLLHKTLPFMAMRIANATVTILCYCPDTNTWTLEQNEFAGNNKIIDE